MLQVCETRVYGLTAAAPLVVVAARETIRLLRVCATLDGKIRFASTAKPVAAQFRC
jgi:hypothetical protein